MFSPRISMQMRGKSASFRNAAPNQNEGMSRGSSRNFGNDDGGGQEKPGLKERMSMRGLSKKIGSKLKAPGAVVTHATHQKLRFRFEIQVQYVESLICNTDQVFVGFYRGEKEFATRPVSVDAPTRKATFSNQPKLVIPCTLFRARKGAEDGDANGAFVFKEFKLALKTASDQKTIGKIHVDFGDYAMVPSGTKRLGAKLSNGAVVVMVVDSVLESSGTGGPLSGRSESFAAPSDYEGSSLDGGSDRDDLDSFDDLGEGEDDQVLFDGENRSNSKNSNPNGNRERAMSESDRGNSNLMTLLKSPRRPDARKDSTSVAAGREKSGVNLNDEQRLLKRIAYLETRNAELEEQNKSLRAAQNESGAQNAKTVDELRIENEELKARTRDFQTLISQQPEMQDLIMELKNVKVALAMTDYEKQELRMELMKTERGRQASGSKKKKLFRVLNGG